MSFVTPSPVSHTLFSNFAPNSYHPEVGRNLKIRFSQKGLVEKFSFCAHFNPNPLRSFSFDFCIKVFSAANRPIFKIFFLPERFC